MGEPHHDLAWAVHRLRVAQDALHYVRSLRARGPFPNDLGWRMTVRGYELNVFRALDNLWRAQSRYDTEIS